MNEIVQEWIPVEQTGDKSEHLAPNESVKDLAKLCRFMMLWGFRFIFVFVILAILL